MRVFSAAVHTTGVNIDGVLANAVAVTVILAFLGTIVIWVLRNAQREITRTTIKAEIAPVLNDINNQFQEIKIQLTSITTVLTNLDTRVSRLEGIEEGKRQAWLEQNKPT
jgi:hypothetical protein